MKVIYDSQFDRVEWENKLRDLTQKERCAYCYKRRLAKTAKTAKLNGFTHFTSTLLISPYQDHEYIIATGKKEAEEKGIEFLYNDFRTLFREGQNIAKEENLYRQKYCGCIYSYKESKFREKINWD